MLAPPRVVAAAPAGSPEVGVMSDVALRSLIAHAVVDPELCAKLLNGEREHVLAQFELEDVERLALRRITASSLQAFAAQLDDWMRSQPYAKGTGDMSQQ
jgi:hypothetical protein